MVIHAQQGYQYCTNGNCEQNCTVSYNCYQNCKGNCQQYCTAGNKCEQSCGHDGKCQQLCNAKICNQRCTEGGNCNMTCKAKAPCTQVCPFQHLFFEKTLSHPIWQEMSPFRSDDLSSQKIRGLKEPKRRSMNLKKKKNGVSYLFYHYIGIFFR